MIHKTRGIVLNHTRVGETSAIVHVFTLDFGSLGFIVNGAFGTKKKGSKVLLLQPLNLMAMDVFYKPGRDIHRVKEFVLERPMAFIPFSQTRRAQAFLLTEVLSRVLRNENSNQPLFLFLVDCIEWLDSGIEGLENLHLFILFHLSSFLGFLPRDNHDIDTQFFDIQEGCFVKCEPSHPCYLDPAKSLIFARLFKANRDNIVSLAVNVGERRVILHTLVTLYELHFQAPGHVRSLEVLSALFKE